MGNEVVTFTQMQSMAKSVAASGLFGVKNVDQAIALMLLAQSEGIHVMTAVRDYHIVNGRPAMKAEAMLARYQEAGGKVTWHALTDQEADATFVCPASPQPVRVEWTIERAQRAGLAGKDVWRAYPRAMLRSRVISEGIRTTMHGVLAGKYTPEEAMHIETLEPLEVSAAIDQMGRTMLQAEVDELNTAMAASMTLESLMYAFQDAYRAAKDRGDEKRMESFKASYDLRKEQLTKPVATVEPAEVTP